jgi:hypothetical protein
MQERWGEVSLVKTLQLDVKSHIQIFGTSPGNPFDWPLGRWNGSIAFPWFFSFTWTPDRHSHQLKEWLVRRASLSACFSCKPNQINLRCERNILIDSYYVVGFEGSALSRKRWVFRRGIPSLVRDLIEHGDRRIQIQSVSTGPLQFLWIFYLKITKTFE